MNYFVTAIGTDSGKTVVSAILVEAFKADYWKPVQSGPPRDTKTVKGFISNKESVFHKERHVLTVPASPHASAKADGVEIKLHDFNVPDTKRDLIIEGAGGLMVPLNDQDMVIDLIASLDCEVVMVSNLYLGSINHTLLSAEALSQRNISVKGVIFNGVSNPESERIILLQTGWKKLLQIEQEPAIDKQVVLKYAEELRQNW